MTEDRLALCDAYAEALEVYRCKAWEQARDSFEKCLALVPDDPPSQVFLSRIESFQVTAPKPDWAGVWSLAEK